MTQSPDDIPASVRLEVYERDGQVCRLCGRGDAYSYETHHILYRSQGGPHELWNLVLLCSPCHRRAHSNVNVWRPLLHEVVKRGGVTALQLKRWSERKKR